MISTLSMFGSMFVATIIFSSKKLQVHPQRLIAYTCMSEAISSFNGVIWAMNTEYVIDYLDLDTVFAQTMYLDTSDTSIIKARKLLANTNDFFFQYFSLLTLALNTCLCIDLILTLRNPFQPAKIRMMLYLGISVVGCIPLSLLTLESIAKGKHSPSPLETRYVDVHDPSDNSNISVKK